MYHLCKHLVNLLLYFAFDLVAANTTSATATLPEKAINLFINILLFIFLLPYEEILYLSSCSMPR